ncbi:MAG: hypothetical protein QOI66_4327 [Myxococcales bacterium]|nr:hypothetical protein [Myxococcales bacterium]
MAVHTVGGRGPLSKLERTALHRAGFLFALSVLFLAAAGCGGAGAAGQSVTSKASLTPSTLTESPSIINRAEPGPILALAFHAPHLWIGTARGLRRRNVSDGTYEWVGADSGLLGRQVSALAVDRTGAAWVATDAGVGRISADAADNLHYEPMAPLAGITALAPDARGAAGAWAGGPHGLYHLDGRSWRPIAALREVPVTSLEPDADGTAVWVGTRGGGLLRIDERTAKVVLRPRSDVDSHAGRVAADDLDEIVGSVRMQGGPRVIAARVAGNMRVVLLSDDGDSEIFRAHPDVPVVAIVGSARQATLIAGVAGAERAYVLRALAHAEAPAKGGIRLISSQVGGRRYAAEPLPLLFPPEVTVAVGGGERDGIWVGSAGLGVARAGPDGPRYLGPGELVGDAERLTVACTTRERCFVVAGGAHAWLTDDRKFRETRLGESDAGRALGVVSQEEGTVSALIAEPSFAGVILTELSTGAETWREVSRTPLVLPTGTPEASFVSTSPDGALWVGLRVRDESGQSLAFRLFRINLDPGSALENRHTVGKIGAGFTPENTAVPPDLTGILFERDTLWWSSGSGMSRWQDGRVRTWGENSGLDNEVCHAVAVGPDGQIWAATSGGLERFVGTHWRSFGDQQQQHGTQVLGLANDGHHRLWVATTKGLRVIDREQAARGDAGTMIVTDGMQDVRIDRFGRIWALGTNAISMVDPSSPAALSTQHN